MLITCRRNPAEEEEEREEAPAPYFWYQQDVPPPPSSPRPADSPTAGSGRGKGIQYLQPEPEYCETMSRLKVVGGGILTHFLSGEDHHITKL